MGYGDFYPRTSFGRIVIVICCVYGVWVVSLVVVTVTNILELGRPETKAFLVIRRLLVVDKMKNTASHVMTSVAKMRHLDKMSGKRKLNLFNRLSSVSTEFRELNR